MDGLWSSSFAWLQVLRATSNPAMPAISGWPMIDHDCSFLLLQMFPTKHLVSRKVEAQPPTDDIGYFIGADPSPWALRIQIRLSQHISAIELAAGDETPTEFPSLFSSPRQ